jgi:hypothetical protein
MGLVGLVFITKQHSCYRTNLDLIISAAMIAEDDRLTTESR